MRSGTAGGDTRNAGDRLPLLPFQTGAHAHSLILNPFSLTAQVCKYYLQGNCAYGDRCRYDHVRPNWAKETNLSSDQGAGYVAPPRVRPDTDDLSEITPISALKLTADPLLQQLPHDPFSNGDGETSPGRPSSGGAAADDAHQEAIIFRWQHQQHQQNQQHQQHQQNQQNQQHQQHQQLLVTQAEELVQQLQQQHFGDGAVELQSEGPTYRSYGTLYDVQPEQQHATAQPQIATSSQEQEGRHDHHAWEQLEQRHGGGGAGILPPPSFAVSTPPAILGFQSSNRMSGDGGIMGGLQECSPQDSHAFVEGSYCPQLGSYGAGDDSLALGGQLVAPHHANAWKPPHASGMHTGAWAYTGLIHWYTLTHPTPPPHSLVMHLYRCCVCRPRLGHRPDGVGLALSGILHAEPRHALAVFAVHDERWLQRWPLLPQGARRLV